MLNRKATDAAAKARLERLCEDLRDLLPESPTVECRKGVASCTLRVHPLLQLRCYGMQDGKTQGWMLALLTPEGDRHYRIEGENGLQVPEEKLRQLLSVESPKSKKVPTEPQPFRLQVAVLEEQYGGDGWQSLGETQVKI